VSNIKYVILSIFIAISFISRGQLAKQLTRLSLSKKGLKYMPKDFDDCIIQIDKFWDDTVKAKAMARPEDEFGGKYHFGLGL
jgi:hypothetical protein